MELVQKVINILLCFLVAGSIYHSQIAYRAQHDLIESINDSLDESIDPIAISIQNDIALQKRSYSVQTLTHGGAGGRRRIIEISEIADSAAGRDHARIQLPSFAQAGFEFANMATTPGVSVEDYQEFLKAIPFVTRQNKQETFAPVLLTLLPPKQLATIEAIFRDFLNRNGFVADEIDWHSIIAFIYTKREETGVHFDGEDTAKYIKWPIRWKEFKLWIPMQEMSNLVLAVGDASEMHDINCVDPWNRIQEVDKHQDCVERRDFENIKWYHHQKMTPQDVIWFAAKDIPHCAVDRYLETYHMFYRPALIIHFRPSAVNVRYSGEMDNDTI